MGIDNVPLAVLLLAKGLATDATVELLSEGILMAISIYRLTT
jgi:hypothetical protein